MEHEMEAGMCVYMWLKGHWFPYSHGYPILGTQWEPSSMTTPCI